MSIIFSYPLNFVGLREGLLAFLGKTEEGKKTSVHVSLTLLLMVLMNGTALFLKDLGLVVGLGGAILGSGAPLPDRPRALVAARGGSYGLV